mgnify:CR=1 FL=1
MDKKEETKAIRKKLLAKCKDLVDLANEFDKEMQKAKHSDGEAHVFLDAKCETFVIQGTTNLKVWYKDANGVAYHLEIEKKKYQ